MDGVRNRSNWRKSANVEVLYGLLSRSKERVHDVWCAKLRLRVDIACEQTCFQDIQMLSKNEVWQRSRSEVRGELRSSSEVTFRNSWVKESDLDARSSLSFVAAVTSRRHERALLLLWGDYRDRVAPTAQLASNGRNTNRQPVRLEL